jgi:hypothetical protein
MTTLYPFLPRPLISVFLFICAVNYWATLDQATHIVLRFILLNVLPERLLPSLPQCGLFSWFGLGYAFVGSSRR